MKGTADWIRVLAFANIIIASIGLCSDIAAAALDWSRDPAIKVGPTGFMFRVLGLRSLSNDCSLIILSIL